MDAGLATRLEHSNLDSADRRRAVQQFRDGAARALVVVKAADEGIDVPEASCALVVTCSGSKRQRVQRFGRILRRQDNKHAAAISILVRGTPEEYVVGRRDEELLGADRVRHHCWDERAAVGELFGEGASTYEPAHQGQRLTQVDDLVGQQLRLLDATARSISPFDGSEATTDYSVEDVAAVLSRSERWVRNNLRRSRIEQPDDEATRIVRAEALRLFDICQAEAAAKERDATPKSLPRPSRPRREPAPLEKTQVKTAAHDLGTGDHAAIAQHLGVDLDRLQRLVTADPMLRYQLEQIDKKLGRSA